MTTETFITPEARQWIVSHLKMGPASVTFKKKDGTERTMKCTLQESVIPEYEKKTERTKEQNDEVLAVYDIEKSGWRSFRLDSVIHISFVI